MACFTQYSLKGRWLLLHPCSHLPTIKGQYMKLKEYLRDNSISVAKFSKKSGINASTLSGYIYHHKTPVPSKMRMIYKHRDKLVRPDDWIL